MERIIAFIVFCMFFVQIGFAQTGDTLSVSRPCGAAHVYLNDELLSLQRLQQFVKSNREAYRAISKAQTMEVFSITFGTIGGVLIGYPIGAALGGGPFVWEMLCIGAGFVAIALPLSLCKDKDIRRGVELYNRGVTKRRQFTGSYSLHVGTTRNGVGMMVKF